MKTVGVIPARYASTRFPGKPLARIAEKPMLQWVWEGALQSTLLDDIVIATDDVRIADACESFGAKAIITSSDLPSGTDRVAAAIAGTDYSIVVNIQGDEPLLQGTIIDELILSLREHPTADVSTPVQIIREQQELLSPNVVKVVCNAQQEALYFSRYPIPYCRSNPSSNPSWNIDEFHGTINSSTVVEPNNPNPPIFRHYLKHIGLYAYTSKALRRFVELPPSFLETTESLEQLRLMEDGATYVCVLTNADFQAVDTPEDAKIVETILKDNHIK